MHMDVIKHIQASGGITLRYTNGVPVQVDGDYWYFPVQPDVTVIVAQQRLAVAYNEFVANNINALAMRGRYLGVWLNPDTDQYYFDITIRATTKGSALKYMTRINSVSQRQILAAFNPLRGATLAVPN